MKRSIALCFLFLATSVLNGSTVRLENDSPFQLKAVIRGADGTILGETTLEKHSNPHTMNMWSDNSPQRDNRSKANRSLTPFTVTWYCMSGSHFSITDNVSTGSLVKALQGSGEKNCSSTQTESYP